MAQLDAQLYSQLQHLRLADHQGPPVPGMGTTRELGGSPFAERPSSSAGDVTCSGDGSLTSDQSLRDGNEVAGSGAQQLGSAGAATGGSAQQPPLLTSMLSTPVMSMGGQDPDAGATLPTRASMDGQPKSSQICFDYTKGLCTRGDKCKYSHDLATIVHFNSREKGICFDYLRNQCHRGLLCRFSHDLSNIAQQCQAAEVFSGNTTTNANNSNAAAAAAAAKGKTNAICYDFVKGVCQRGSECRYSHDLSLIARTARGGQQSQRSSEICYDYLRGRCNRGTSCKYSHNISFLATPAFLAGGMGGPGAGVTTSAGGAPGGPPPLPVPGSASLGGALPGGTASLGGAGLVAGIPGLAGTGRLAPSISADPLMLGGPPTSAPGGLPPGLTPPMGPDMDGRGMGPMSPDLGDGRGESPWSGAPGLPPPQHMHALAAAQRQHLAAAAAAHYGMHVAGLGDLPPGLPGAPPGLGVHGTGFACAAQQQALASSLAMAQQRALMHPPHVEQGPSQLHRAHSAPLGPLQLGAPGAESISALLANLGDNPALLAETLSNLAVAAQAQVHAAQRMSAPGNTGLSLPQHSAPPPMGAPFEAPGSAGAGSNHGGAAPGGSDEGSLLAPFGGEGYPTSGGQGPGSGLGGNSASVPVPDAPNRSNSGGQMANSLTAASLSPDLLPLLKEIWNKS